jgi:hypothetical protein
MAVKMTYYEDGIRKDGSRISRQVQQNSIEFEKVLDYMRVGTAFSVNDMRSIFCHFVDFLVRYLPEGSKVYTPLGCFSLAIQQSYAEDESNDPAGSQSHKLSLDKLTIRIRPAKEILNKIKSAIKIELVDRPSPACPTIISLGNTDKPEAQNTGSSGDVLCLMGSNLSFSKEDAETGVFFIETTAKTESRTTSYSRQGSNILNFKIPTLATGTYTIEVRTKPTNKDIRTGALSTPFTVV